MSRIIVWVKPEPNELKSNSGTNSRHVEDHLICFDAVTFNSSWASMIWLLISCEVLFIVRFVLWRYSDFIMTRFHAEQIKPANFPDLPQKRPRNLFNSVFTPGCFWKSFFDLSQSCLAVSPWPRGCFQHLAVSTSRSELMLLSVAFSEQFPQQCTTTL